MAGGRVVTPEAVLDVDVAVRDGTIAGIGTADRTAAEVIDASGCFVLPGGVDPHSHLLENLPEATTAAAFGGTTTTLVFTNPGPDERPADALLRAIDQVGGEAAVDVGLHASIYRPALLGEKEIESLQRLGADAIKLFLAYPELGIMASVADLSRAMSAAARLGLPVQVHCEDGDLIETLAEAFSARGERGPRAFVDTRPPAVEETAVCRALAVANLTGCELYVTHISCAGVIDHIRSARHRGHPVRAEVCIHHLLLDESRYRGEDAASFLVAPPLRSVDDLTALEEAARDGTIDSVGSDHGEDRTPVESRLSSAGEGYGLRGVEARLPLLLSWGLEHGIPIERLAHLAATGPADAFGYLQKGRIAVGCDADLVVWDPSPDWVVGNQSFRDRSGSIYSGLKVRGQVRSVLLGGRPLVIDGELAGTARLGRVVRPARR